MMTQGYAHKVEATLTDFAEHLERLDRAVKALSAANNGMCAALNADLLRSGDDMAYLFDILIDEIKGQVDGMAETVRGLRPVKCQGERQSQ